MRADILLMALILGMDRAVKALIPRLLEIHQSIPVIPGFFRITHIRNTGGAFGILADWDSPVRQVFFIFVSIAALVILFLLYRQAVKDNLRSLRLSLVFIAGGAMGNLYDRIATGEVVDFLDFFIGRHHWPAFNVADISIFIGAVFLAWLFLTGRAHPEGKPSFPDAP